MAAAALIGVLVLTVIVLGYYMMQYKGMAAAPAKSGMWGHHPKWQYGSRSAGHGGSLHAPGPQHNPAGWAKKMPLVGNFGKVGGTGGCGPGEVAVTYKDDSGAVSTFCRPADAGFAGSTCSPHWDPAATAEAQALATVGSLQHDNFGETKLQSAVNAAYDSNIGLDDNELSQLMHSGGSP